MRRIVAVTALSIALFFSLAGEAHAKKLLPRASPKAGAKKVSSKGITTKVKFRGDRRAIVVTFTNLSIASSVSYTLTYDSKGITQSAGGTIALPTSEPVAREIPFGTCSAGICRYDTGVKNAKFSVTTTQVKGKKIVKTFRLKV